MSNSDTDRAWFKKHREANFRIRRGSPAEIEKIACRVMGAVPDGFSSAEFDEEREWRILVINVARRHTCQNAYLAPEGRSRRHSPILARQASQSCSGKISSWTA